MATVITNRTPYPDAEVVRIVSLGLLASRGPVPREVIVGYRTLPTDTRLGFTPYDHRLPTRIWVEPASRYPQQGAWSWKDELLTSTLHEVQHYRSAKCKDTTRCDRIAEAYAQRLRPQVERSHRL